MSNFYNKKDKYVDNDFGVEDDDFLNSSMRDMDQRTKSTKKKKINQDYDGGIQFVDLANLDRDTLFKSSTRTPENAEYMSTVLRGFIFIFMLLISLFAIFLIFKTPYYSYYNQDEPIILDENKSMMTSNPFIQSQPQTQEELELEIIEPEENNVKIPTAVVSKPKISDEDEMLRREFENSKSAKNKQDTELTKLLKNSDTVVVKEKQEKKPAIAENKRVENMPQDVPAEIPTKELQKETTSKKNSGVFKYPARGDKKMLTESSKIFAQNEITIVENKPKVANKTPAKVELKEKASAQTNTPQDVQVNKPNNVAEQNVWLVNISSTQNKNDMHERLLRLKNQYKNALVGTTFYLVDYKTDKGTTYRISVTENQSGIAHPSFASNGEAKSFCASLKSQGLDCFVSSVYKSALPRYIIK